MRLGFTGTQRGMTEAQRATVFALLVALQPRQVHHGGCHGADTELDQMIRLFFPRIARHIHPGPESSRDGGVVWPVKPYLDRNRDIVDNCELLVATPSGLEKLRSGTWATVRHARRVNRPHVILLP